MHACTEREREREREVWHAHRFEQRQKTIFNLPNGVAQSRTRLKRLSSSNWDMLANLENSAVATGLEKVSFHSNPKEKQSKECSNYHTIALISHASKVMFKILQARLQQYVNCDLSDVHAGFIFLFFFSSWF